MFGFLRRWLNGSREADHRSRDAFASRDAAPVATASVMGRSAGHKATAGSWETEEARRECEEFWSRVGLPFAPDDDLCPESELQLRAWLDASTPDAEPKAIVRLALLLADHGESLHKQPGISLFLDGRWTQGPGPSAETDEALALLARVLKMPIKLYFTKEPGAPAWLNEYKP